MNMLPDEPLWLLQDGDQHTAHGSVMEAMQWLQAEHPDAHGWKIVPLSDTRRMIKCDSSPSGAVTWTVRRA